MSMTEIEAHRSKRGPVRKRNRRGRKGFLERITDDLREDDEVPPCAPSDQQQNGGA